MGCLTLILILIIGHAAGYVCSWLGCALWPGDPDTGSLVGYVAGFVLGVLLFRRLSRRGEERRSREAWEQAQNGYLEAVAGLMAKMAKADGPVSRDEISFCRSIFGNSKFDAAQTAFLVAAFRRARDDDRTVFDYAGEVALRVRDLEVRESIYFLLWDLAGAEGYYSDQELRVLRQLPDRLVISPGWFVWQGRRRGLFGAGDTFAGREEQGPAGGRSGRGGRHGGSAAPPPPRDPLEQYYSLLGVSSKAGERELKAAYHRRARQLHPDVLKAKGLPEGLLQKANEEMAALNEAWQKICAARGIK